MITTYVLRRVESERSGALRLVSRWHQMPGRIVSVALLLLIVLSGFVYPTVAPVIRWLWAIPFLLLGVGDLYFFRQQRVVLIAGANKEVILRDRLRIPFSPAAESRIPFSDIRGVGTVRMTAADPQSSPRILTLHLGDEDRYLITVPGRWEHRDLEEKIRAAIGLVNRS